MPTPDAHWSVPVNVVNGVPLCPDCQEPMRDRGDSTWDCPTWGPLWDKVQADLAASFDEPLWEATNVALIAIREARHAGNTSLPDSAGGPR